MENIVLAANLAVVHLEIFIMELISEQAKGAIISANILKISGGVGGGGGRLPMMLEEVMIQQRVLITVNLLQISGVRKVRYRFRSRRSTLARSGTDSRQVQYFRKVRSRFRGRHSTFARYGAEFDAGAALNQRGGWGGGATPPPHDV